MEPLSGISIINRPKIYFKMQKKSLKFRSYTSVIKEPKH